MQLKHPKAIFKVNLYSKTYENDKIFTHPFAPDCGPDIL
jgi:hypothetical protein